MIKNQHSNIQSVPSSQFLSFLYELGRIKISGPRLVDLAVVADEHGDLRGIKNVINSATSGS